MSLGEARRRTSARRRRPRLLRGNDRAAPICARSKRRGWVVFSRSLFFGFADGSCTAARSWWPAFFHIFFTESTDTIKSKALSERSSRPLRVHTRRPMLTYAYFFLSKLTYPLDFFVVSSCLLEVGAIRHLSHAHLRRHSHNTFKLITRF